MSEDISESLITSIAQALNLSHVPCVLWGHPLLNVHGVPSIIGSIDFVVRDDCLKAGAKTLTSFKTLSHCPDQEICPASSQDRPTPPPAFHMHIEASEVTVGLYPQSDTLWFLPPLDSTLLFPETNKLPPHFVLASNQSILPPWRPGRGSGVFKSTQHPVVVPRSIILLEAFLRLYARDSGKQIGGFAISMVAYMEEYVDDDGFLDASQLPQPLRVFYRELREGKKPLRQWTEEFKKALGNASVEVQR